MGTEKYLLCLDSKLCTGIYWNIQNNENSYADTGQKTGIKNRRHVTYKCIVPAWIVCFFFWNFRDTVMK